MGGFCFALTNIMLRRLHQQPTSSSMLAMFAGGALMAFLTALAGEQVGLVPVLPPLQGVWLAWVGAMGLMFLVGNMGLQYGAARLSASTTSVIMLSEVVFASLSALWLGAGEISARTLFGGALVLLAALLSAVPFKPWRFSQN